MEVAYLGPAGSFSSLAVNFLVPTALKVPQSSLQTVMASQADYFVVPVENSLEGSVLPLLDLIVKKCPPIQAELILPIKQQLLIQPHFLSHWQQAKKIYSHPQALAQVQPFIERYLPNSQSVPLDSTTAGANWLLEHPQENSVAVGSIEAAKEFGLAIAQKNIQSNEQNATRFWLLGETTPQRRASLQHKASLIIDLAQDQPGSLHQILAFFAQQQLNLTKIESRPKKTCLGEYYFLIDVQIPQDPQAFPRCLKALTREGINYRHLGTYPVYHVSSIVS